MREPMHRAAGRRDDRLAKIRKVSLWITGGAAAASLGLGTAFAHALPGHATTSTVSTAGTATSQGAARPAGGTTVPSRSASSPAAAGSAAKGASSSASRKTTSHRSERLTKPASKPAPTQAPPVVVSGGS